MALVILTELGAHVEAAIRAAVDDVEVIQVGSDPPEPGTRGDVFFGGHGPNALAYAACVPWVQLSGTGVDKIPTEMYEGRIITCARGAGSVPISEFVLAAMLAFEQRIPEVWLDESPEHWNLFRLGGLDTKVLGLVGLGGIATAVAARALPFGMTVRALRRTDAPSPIEGVEVVSDLGELLAGADHVVLAVPATARTRHLIDADALAAMKPGVHLVNIARGSLIDQEALRSALDDGRVARATLDTVTPEPLPAGHWLYRHPKVRLSAHVSWASPAGFDATIAIFIENLRRRARGDTLLGVVDPTEGY